MSGERVVARYLVETPLDPAAVAEVMAGEQSSGTFVRVGGETDALRARSRATVEAVVPLATVDRPSLPNAWLSAGTSRGPGAARRSTSRIRSPTSARTSRRWHRRLPATSTTSAR